MRVWKQVLSGKDVTKFLAANKKHSKEIAQKAVDRVKAGYRPPLAAQNNLDAEVVVAVALMEELADERVAPVRSRALYEFDCAGGCLRILQFSSFRPGPERHVTVEQLWEYIAPDTVGAELKSLVCTRS